MKYRAITMKMSEKKSLKYKLLWKKEKFDLWGIYPFDVNYHDCE